MELTQNQINAARALALSTNINAREHRNSVGIYCEGDEIDTKTVEYIFGDFHSLPNTEYPKLIYVEGNCIISTGTKMENLQFVYGDCEIHRHVDVPKLEIVSAYCIVFQNTSVPALQEIGGDCFLENNVSAQSLKKVYGDFNFRESVFIPVLNEVLGSCQFCVQPSTPLSIIKKTLNSLNHNILLKLADTASSSSIIEAMSEIKDIEVRKLIFGF